MVDVQPDLGKEMEGSLPGSPQDLGEERVAPNGRLAVLVGGLWAGYLITGDDRGTGGKSICLFQVESLPGGTLKVEYRESCPRDTKKALNKQIHFERSIVSYETVTINGDRCQLFTA